MELRVYQERQMKNKQILWLFTITVGATEENHSIEWEQN